jgi:hypothetical protein
MDWVCSGKMMLRITFVLEGQGVVGRWRKLRKEELHNLYS